MNLFRISILNLSGALLWIYYSFRYGFCGSVTDSFMDTQADTKVDTQVDTRVRLEPRAGTDAMTDQRYKRKNRGQRGGGEDQTDCSPRIMSRRVCMERSVEASSSAQRLSSASRSSVFPETCFLYFI